MKARFDGLDVALSTVATIFPGSLAQDSDADYWIALGDDLALNRSDYEGALAAYEYATRIDPGNIGAWDRKAAVLEILSQQAYRKVLDLCKTRLAKDPDDAWTRQFQAVAMAGLGRQDDPNQSIEKALEIYEQEIQDHPKNATAWFYMAELTSNRTEALYAYEKVIELKPEHAPAWKGKGDALVALGRESEARAAFSRARELGYQGGP